MGSFEVNQEIHFAVVMYLGNIFTYLALAATVLLAAIGLIHLPEVWQTFKDWVLR